MGAQLRVGERVLAVGEDKTGSLVTPTQGEAHAQATTFLTAHSITMTALGKATLSAGSLTLPINHGYVTTRRHNGVLYHEGGVKFANGTHSLALRGFVLIRRADETVLTAKFDGVRVTVAHVGQLKETVSGMQATVTGTLRLSVAAARGINHLIGHHVVAAGLNLGTLTSTITYG